MCVCVCVCVRVRVRVLSFKDNVYSRRGGRSSSSKHGISQMMLLPIWASEPIVDVALLWDFFFF